MNLFLLLLISCFSFNHSTGVDDGQCPDLNLTSEVVYNETNGLYTISVDASGGQEPYKYVFIKSGKGNKMLNPDSYSDNYITLKSKGSYWCVVYDKNGCRSKIQSEVK